MKKFLVLVMALCVFFTLGLAHAETDEEAVKLEVTVQGHKDTCEDTDAELYACEHEQCHKAPTCTDKGAQAKHCTSCGQIIEIVELVATGHEEMETISMVYDCTKAYTEDYMKCKKCDYITDMDGKEIKAPVVKEAKNKDHVRIADPEATFNDVCGESVSLPAVCRDCEAELPDDDVVEFVVDHGKNYEKVTKEAVAATCQGAGNTAEITCTFCNKVKVESVVLPQVGHNWVYREGTAGKPCTEQEWPEHWYCSFNCGKGHRNQYDAKGNLIVLDLDDILIEGTRHQYSEPIDIEVTCTTPGYWDYQKCTECGDETWWAKFDPQHDVVRNQGTAATCENDGVNAYNYCTRCDWTDGKDIVIPAHGHSYDKGTVPNQPTTERVPTEEEKKGVTGHVIFENWKEDKDTPATCEKDGYKAARYCEFCKELYTASEVLPKTGHDWKLVEGSEGVAPTCTKPGTSVEQYCANKGCGKTKGGVEGDIAALGHAWSDVIPAKVPTCAEGGYYAYSYCTRDNCDVKGEWAAKLAPAGGEANFSLFNPETLIIPTNVAVTGVVTKNDKGAVVLPDAWQLAALNHGINYGLEEDDPATEENETYLDGIGLGLMAEIAPVKETCTTNGREEGGIYCTLCNAVIVKPVVIPATGHNYSEHVALVNPTCTETGVADFHYCSNDGCTSAIYTVMMDTEDAMGMSAVGATFTIVKKDGAIDMEKLPVEAVIPALGHDEVEVPTKPATCEADGYTGGVICERCKVTIKEETVLKATGHSMTVEVEPAKAPTCTEDGYKALMKCANPGCTKTEGGKTATVAKLGHDYANATYIPGTPATCGEDGKTEAYKCGRCDEFIIEHKVIPATGKHTWLFTKDGKQANKTVTELKAGEYLCTTTLYDNYNECTVCDYTEGEKWGGEGHNIITYDEEKPTCTQMGLTGDAYCTNKCGYHVVNEVVPALGHDYVKYYKDDKQIVSCTKAGYTEGEKCSRCGDVKTESVWHDALNHKNLDGTDAWEHIAAKDATCTESGNNVGLKCKLCGAKTGCEEIAALGHDTNGVEWTVLTDEDGTSLRVKRCKRCNLIVEMKPIENAGKLGDVDGNGRVNLTDALLVIEFYVGNNPSPFNEEVADFNLDGKINTSDALAIVNYWAGA